MTTKRPVLLRRKDVLALIRKERERWMGEFNVDTGARMALDNVLAALSRMR